MNPNFFFGIFTGIIDAQIIDESTEFSDGCRMDACMDGWMDGCMYVCMYVCMYALTRETGSRFRPPPEAEIPKLLKTKLFARS